MEENRRVLLICTGGTIGMVRTERGYAPKAGSLGKRMAKMPQFQDPDGAPRCMPPSRFGTRVQYEIMEYVPLLDSSNLGVSDWVRVAQDITRHYDDYDAFVVVHGTDTMAYTASALSYMLENLSKTVIVTGSQLPLSEVRNDAIDNLLGALTLAGNYNLPEVCVFFHNKLMRGNRVRKVDTAHLDAFDSGNLPPLAHMGIHVEVATHLLLPTPTQPLHLRPIQERHVACLRLFPGLTAAILKNFLAPPLRGLVLETFGAGNAPDNRPELLDALREASDRGVVIVNCTQCHRGSVTTDYASGMALQEAQVVGGADMTVEAALTKLAWLLSDENLTPEQVRAQVGLNLRGEITGPLSGVPD